MALCCHEIAFANNKTGRNKSVNVCPSVIHRVHNSLWHIPFSQFYFLVKITFLAGRNFRWTLLTIDELNYSDLRWILISKFLPIEWRWMNVHCIWELLQNIIHFATFRYWFSDDITKRAKWISTFYKLRLFTKHFWR